MLPAGIIHLADCSPNPVILFVERSEQRLLACSALVQRILQLFVVGERGDHEPSRGVLLGGKTEEAGVRYGACPGCIL